MAEVTRITFEMDVDGETRTATYVEPNKIAELLAEEQSLGGFLCELRDVELDPEPSEEPKTRLPRTLTQREVDLMSAFEERMQQIASSPDEMRSAICGFVARFSFRAELDLDEIHNEIDDAYDYYIASQGPSDA